MNPNPKTKALRYQPYIDFIKRQRCAQEGWIQIGRDVVVPAHQRQLHGGGTGLKPSDFHALPLLNSIHQKDEHGKGYVFTPEVAAEKCLSHVAGYLMQRATVHQIVQIIDMIGGYIKDNSI